MNIGKPEILQPQFKVPDVVLLCIEPEPAFSLPLYSSRVSAGFPSPADDYIELSLNIADYVASNPNSTFYVKVNGDSMINAHIPDGAVLAVDISAKPKSGNIIICYLNNEFTVKRLELRGNKVFLKPENPNYKTIEVTPDDDFRIWGKVVTVFHKDDL